MEIPKLNENGELPPGEHVTTMKELEKIFGKSSLMRKQLFQSFLAAVDNLKNAGVKMIWVNGSFTTSKEDPNDIDGCWLYEKDIDKEKLDPVFLKSSTKEMKEKYGIDFLMAYSGNDFPMVFRKNRDNEEKGIIVI